MLTPSPTHPMPQDRGFGPFPDHEREAHIADCGRLMQAAMQRYAESGDLADLGDAHRWRRPPVGGAFNPTCIFPWDCVA